MLKEYLTEAASLVVEAIFGSPKTAFAGCIRIGVGDCDNSCTGGCGLMKQAFNYQCWGSGCEGGGVCYKCLCSLC